jgi:hypothetical protein
MIKMYLQLLATLGSFFGAVACMCWFILTYMYSSQISAKGGTLNIDWPRLTLMAILLTLSIVIFVACVKWVKHSKKIHREKMARYRQFRS